MFGLRSIGIASDILALGDRAQVEAHPDRVVLRTPAEPDFWSGNKVIFRSGDVDAQAQVARFEADFPRADHVTLEWDATDMGDGPGLAALAEAGFEIDRSDVLACEGPPLAAAAPEGIALRVIESAEDWAAVEALQLETGLEEGHAPDMLTPFITRRMESRRRQSAAGEGVWVGAFEGGRLVGDMGLVLGPGILRYQSVETRASHRGRGICPALLHFAALWGLERRAGATLVIIADAGERAARVYRRQGFAPVETIVSAMRRPDAAVSAP